MLFRSSGRLTVNGEERRVLLNPRRGAVFTRHDDVTLRGDFDSAAGFSASRIPLRCPLAVYPVPIFKETLTKSIHIALTIVSDIYAVQCLLDLMLNTIRITPRCRLTKYQISASAALAFAVKFDSSFHNSIERTSRLQSVRKTLLPFTMLASSPL